jgi:tRNA pseudouridine55 synthase
MDLPKRYVADIKLGEATDTQDAAGEVIRTGEWGHVTTGGIREILTRFEGKRTQTPPMYSALKHKGTPLYALARKGQEVERSPREVNTYEIELVECDLPLFRVEVYCSRGMYVRVLAEEIGEALGAPAHLHSLVRTEIGHFSIDSAVSDEGFDRLLEDDAPGVSMSDALQHLPAVELTGQQSRNVANGIAPRLGSNAVPGRGFMRLVTPDGALEAIAESGPGGMISLKKVFVSPAGQ